MPYRGGGRISPKTLLFTLLVLGVCFSLKIIVHLAYRSKDHIVVRDSTSGHIRTEPEKLTPKQPVVGESLLDSKLNRTRYVVMVTHQRSGSSMLGQLMNFNPDAFYWFEPLDAVYQAMYGTAAGYNVPSDLQSYINGSYRSLPREEEELLVEMMYNILTCRFEKLPTELLAHKFLPIFRSDQAKMIPYIDCVGKIQVHCEGIIKNVCGFSFSKSKNFAVCRDNLFIKSNVNQSGFYVETAGKSSRNMLPKYKSAFNRYRQCANEKRKKIFKCVPLGEELCKKSPVRAIKVVRSPFATAERLRGLLPSLVLVYNMRHPVAIASSRSRTAGGESYMSAYAGKDVSKEAKLVCQIMYKDLKTYIKTKKDYPDKVLLFSYEKYSKNPYKSAEYLYGYLGSRPPQSVKDWLHNTTATSSKVSAAWKLRVPTSTYLQYRSDCRDLLNEFSQFIHWDDEY